MSGRRVLLLVGLAAVLALPGAASAQTRPEPPRSFEELLERVQEGWRRERAENREREAGFLRRKQEQQELLDAAVAERERLEARSDELERRLREGETEVARIEEQLDARLGNLGELFGVVRQVAGDTRGRLASSLVSAQIPGRGEALRALAESRRLPRIEQIEKLWQALLQEAVESGRVVRFEAEVIDPDGTESRRDVVRAGVFNAVSDGKYLEWNADLGKLAVIPRQPAGRYLETASALESATEGPVRFAVDPSRGQILSLLVQTPDLRERIGFGGAIGYAILLLGVSTIVFGLVRGVTIVVQRRKVAAQKDRDRPDEGNALGRVISVWDANATLDTETLELKLDEAVLRESSRLERGLWLVKVVSVVAPLMGLLGTVTGMIQTFQAITLFGTGDPRMMAGGISEALVTTMLGLFVAIPLVLLHSWLASMTRGVIDVLDEQSAGLIARRAEAHGRSEA